jgi:hypothetical protein
VDLDLALIGGGDDHVRRGRMEAQRELTDAVRRRAGRGRAERVRVLGADPGLDLAEELVGGTLTREETALGRLAGRVESELGHGSLERVGNATIRQPGDRARSAIGTGPGLQQ